MVSDGETGLNAQIFSGVNGYKVVVKVGVIIRATCGVHCCPPRWRRVAWRLDAPGIDERHVQGAEHCAKEDVKLAPSHARAGMSEKATVGREKASRTLFPGTFGDPWRKRRGDGLGLWIRAIVPGEIGAGPGRERRCCGRILRSNSRRSVDNWRIVVSTRDRRQEKTANVRWVGFRAPISRRRRHLQYEEGKIRIHGTFSVIL